MIRNTILAAASLSLIGLAGFAHAGPEDDRVAFEKYYTARFAETPREDFINGIYSIDKASRAQWEDIEEFPPYELDVDAGEEQWGKSFANGKGYADCFGGDVSKLRGMYPSWDADKSMVMTLELAINNCREANGEKPLGYKKGKLAQISAYVAMQGRGQTMDTVVPSDAKAMAAYEDGKQFFYTKRGQLNFSCADCHMSNAGNYVRADRLSPALGHTSHFPVYRSKWGGLGTLHRRFGGCNNNIRAQPFKAQGSEYRNLEFFLAYMNNGLELNGPGARK